MTVTAQKTVKGNKSSPFQNQYTPCEEVKSSFDDLKVHSKPRAATER